MYGQGTIYPKSVIRNFCEQNVRQQPLLLTQIYIAHLNYCHNYDVFHTK